MDRALVNQKWSEVYGHIGLEVLNISRYDHQPLLLTKKIGVQVALKRNKLFRFEAKWIKMEASEQVMKQAWNENNRR